MVKTPFARRGRVCGVVAARTAAEAWRQLQQALRWTNTVELRLDWLAKPAETQKLLARIQGTRFRPTVNLIATCRLRGAGGKFAGDVRSQLSILRSAIAAGCRWIDLEIETVDSYPRLALDLLTSGARRIVSFHDFRELPKRKRLEQIAERMQQVSVKRGFDAAKIAAECHTYREGLRLLELANGPNNLVTVPMGENVAPLRILALRNSVPICYGPVEQATAPGQVQLAELCALYRAGNLSRNTKVYGVIGNPITHSLSPALHNSGFQARKIDAVYVPFLVTNLRDFLESIGRLGIAGFSVTLPHKRQVMPYLDGCDDAAREIGAVNTVSVSAKGKLFGYNTDSLGILRALEGHLHLRRSRVLVVGAGGAARTAAFTVARSGGLVSICSRNKEKARRLAFAVHGSYIQREQLPRLFFDAVINATPVGMYPHSEESPLTAREMNCALAFDTVYRPRRTRFLEIAAEHGIKIVSGFEMFMAQGIAQWEIWTGMRAPREVMRRAVLSALRQDQHEKAAEPTDND